MVGWNAVQLPPIHQRNIGGEVLPDEFGSEPLLGYRSWHVVNAGDGSGYALKSLHISHIWNRQIQAFCYQPAAMHGQRLHIGMVSPDPNCSCGIYAQLPEHPIGEWDILKRGNVSASGTIAMWGRIIQCERGYKAQYGEIQDPLVLDMSCVKDCEEEPTRIGLNGRLQTPFPAYCATHARTAVEIVTVEVSVWLREVCERLSRRYGLDVLTWI
ncbi:MAG: hypothetical protein WBZ40_01095 [Acidimicrobiia bacterium]